MTSTWTLGGTFNVTCLAGLVLAAKLGIKRSTLEFVAVHLAGANLAEVFGNEASFEYADLLRWAFDRCDLSLADFTGANLRGADFANSTLRGAQSWGADLRSANFLTATLEYSAYSDGSVARRRPLTAGATYVRACVKQRNVKPSTV